MTRLSAAQTRLVESCIAKVATMAKQLSPKMPHASLDELRSAGYEGLVQAALRYDPSCSVPFAAFAHYRVRGAMIDAARRAAPEIRRRARAMRALQATQALLEHAEHSRASPEVGDPRTLRERVAAAAELVAHTTFAVLLTKLRPEDPDDVRDPSADIEEQIAQHEVLIELRRAVARCNPEERDLIDALYVQGLTMHEYGEKIGKNVSTISRHHAKVIARLTRELRPAPPAVATPGLTTPSSPAHPPMPPTPSARGPPVHES